MAGFAGYVGWRIGGIRQFAVSVGLIIGLFGSAFAYTKLAFLVDKSWLRSAVLAVLSAAIALLSSDVFMAFGRAIQHSIGIKSPIRRRVNKLAGVLVGVFGAILVLELIAIVPGRVGPGVVRVQINESVILAATSRVIPPPQLFQTIAYLVSPFSSPTVFVGAEPTFTASQTDNVEQAFNDLDAAISADASSVVKISSWGCGSTTVGSGFLVAKQYIVTNAHVVAGVDRISVIDNQDIATAAYTVLFDPSMDVAVLYTISPLSGKPLKINTSVSPSGSVAAVLGYPSGGGFLAGDATILQDLQASGSDIYGKNNLTRHIYAVRSSIVPGNSGGPLIATNGDVIGLIFGHSLTQNRTGYAIAMDHIAGSIMQVMKTSQKVSTGACEAR